MIDLYKNFLDSVVRQIEKHIDDGEYSIETLVKTIGINRTAFFKKMKSLTGISPIEFIRDIRLQNAARLLENEQLLIKDVCYHVGFTDRKYFARCFRSKYQMSPSQYKSHCNTN
jgi:AraC-like DNA-binding protein